MYVQFPALALLALAVALIGMTALAWRNHRRAVALAAQLAAEQLERQRSYALGHGDGLALGLARGGGECEVRVAKAYEAGYNRALVDVAGEMQAERGAEYHAISA